MLNSTLQEYCEAIFDTDSDRALQIVHSAFENGVSAEDIVFRVVIPSIEQFLTALVENQNSLAQHFLASQVAAEVVEEMLPRFLQKPVSAGQMVIGTSPGDYHGLGKRIVSGCLKAQMLGVIDLGLNVSAERFVDAALENNAQIIGISSMMVHTARGENGCRKVRRILQERGLEEHIKIIVGGAPYRFDDQLYRQVGADAWAENGIVAAAVITGLIREVTPL
ncbi:MAG: cobalamin-dependent protein [Desulfuromonadaceae bacterium]|nr:cobalamin-dependent protein [Desulfuromonadaceae bacterium]